jgi:hypothetical protein
LWITQELPGQAGFSGPETTNARSEIGAGMSCATGRNR